MQLFRVVLLLSAIAGINALSATRRQTNGCDCAGMSFYRNVRGRFDKQPGDEYTNSYLDQSIQSAENGGAG